MDAQRMHAGELGIDAPLVRRLIARRFPGWTGPPVRRLVSVRPSLNRAGGSTRPRSPR
ncbi:hypothetical protein ACR9VJ_32985 [Streptomyces sp. H49]|uniref:hypothetical protein n=1 Tax=Streptomyces sp. H49 TaxID=3444117 RepID=UPI003F4AA6F1